MRAFEIRDAFGLENLALVERPDPRPGPGQVLLRMRAVSLNARDVLTVRGRYNPRQPLPLIPCSDGVGEVVELGEGVERVAVGERVMPIFAQRWLAGEPTREKIRSTLGGPLDGTLAERMALDAEGLVRAPGHLTDEEAATLPCAALTAWSAVVDQARLRPGDTVLVQGTGGVAIFALQFARALGARVILTSSSDARLERARALGAWQTINYKTTPDWGAAARKLTDGGVDLVVEVGGATTLGESLAAVRPGGQISLVGVLGAGAGDVNIVPLFMRRIRVQGILVGHREAFEAMNRAVARHELRPAVGRVFAFEEARAAFEQMLRGGTFGKVCLRVG